MSISERTGVNVSRTRACPPWLMVTLIFSGGLINYMDRAVFGLLAPTIATDLNLSASQLGLAFSVFAFGYTGCAFFGGYLADKFGAKKVLNLSMIIWSAFCAATGLVHSFAALLFVRFGFGVGESPYLSATSKVLYNWFSREKFAGAFGISSAGQPLGGVVAGPLIALFAAAFGWRISFICVGAIGILWVIVWAVFASDKPSSNPENDHQGDERSVAPSASERTFREVLRDRTVTAVCITFFCHSYLLFFFLSWFPSYLSLSRGLKLTEMGIASSIPWALGALGLIVGGLISNAVVARSSNSVWARKMIIVPGLFGAGLCVASVVFAESLVLAISLMAVAIGLIYMTGPNYTAIAFDRTPPEHVGKMSGFLVFVANVSGIIAPIVTGFIVDRSGSYTSAFVLAGVVVTIGAVCLASSGRGEPDQPKVSS